MRENPLIIEANWPAPVQVKAYTTTRVGGVSSAPYYALNLASHVGDKSHNVLENRLRLQTCLPKTSTPFWLNQTHSTQVVAFDENNIQPDADASFADQPGQVLAVMTADCLPILFCDERGRWVAACHAGWRGLVNGIVENTVDCYPGEIRQLIAWIGPAISQTHFEVGEEVREKFIAVDGEYAQFFKMNQRSRFQFDFVGLAKMKLTTLGVRVFGGDYCSYADSERFYSYRRDGETGRMASLIWLVK